MRYPEKLKLGDTVGIVCNSSPVEQERIAACRKVLAVMGYQTKVADNLSQVYGGYMAGTGQHRAAQLNKMFADPEVKAIFCARGGDGGTRPMPYVDFDLIRKNPKIFVGYSDVTSLHVAINQNCDLVTFHGPMVSSNMVDHFDQETADSFFAAIHASEGSFDFQNPAGFELAVLQEGAGSGCLVGGNLSVLSAGFGTPYEIDTKDKILFLEDVDEGVYRIERYLWQLKNSGKLAAAKGLLLGQFQDCKNTKMQDFDVVRCVADAVEGLDLPVMYNLQSGHDYPMMTLPLGATCRMDTATKRISFEVQRKG